MRWQRRRALPAAPRSHRLLTPLARRVFDGDAARARRPRRRRLPGAAARCERLAEEVDAGIVAHGTVERPELGGKVYAYEVDGFGNAHLMDDANVPSLLSLPWLGYLAATDPTYERTRAYVLSPKTNVRAAPSPHTAPGGVPCLTALPASGSHGVAQRAPL